VPASLARARLVRGTWVECLALLPPGPDAVRTLPVRGTWSSTLANASPTSNLYPLGKGFGPAGADCGFREPLAPRLARPGKSRVAILLATIRFPGRIAQRESARFTRGRSLVRSQVRPLSQGPGNRVFLYRIAKPRHGTPSAVGKRFGKFARRLADRLYRSLDRLRQGSSRAQPRDARVPTSPDGARAHARRRANGRSRTLAQASNQALSAPARLYTAHCSRRLSTRAGAHVGYAGSSTRGGKRAQTRFRARQVPAAHEYDARMVVVPSHLSAHPLTDHHRVEVVAER
jgi:hypothetical protein